MMEILAAIVKKNGFMAKPHGIKWNLIPSFSLVSMSAMAAPVFCSALHTDSSLE